MYILVLMYVSINVVFFIERVGKCIIFFSFFFFNVHCFVAIELLEQAHVSAALVT